MISESALPAAAGIDHAVKPPAGAGADATSGDGEMGTGPTDQHRVALPDHENG
jgi:hypothetical protein